MKFDSQRPIYLQLLEDFKIKISNGEWKAGEKIDSVRNLAKIYEVNPNTVQKALAELERDGFCESRRTAGRFVTEDTKLISKLENKTFEKIADDFIQGAKNLNLEKDEAIEQLREYWEWKMIDIKNLTMVYGDRAVLDKLDLKLEEGQIIGLLGENGSGKTTLLRILAGLERNYKGDVKIKGENPGGLTNSLISYQPDHLAIDDNLKIVEIVDLYRKFYEDFQSNKFYDLLEKFDISKDLKMKECSKGMRDKVQIALTLSRKAKIYLLDEPISGVDPKSRKIVIDTIIDNFDYQGILLISTHLISAVENILDVAIFLDKGKIIINQSADEIREDKGMTIEEYFVEVM